MIPDVRSTAVLLGALALTTLDFVRIDATSHSASDTLRPLLIQMGPLWVVAVALVLLWRRPYAE